VIAPDLPGFGFTEGPPARNYKYTFDSLAQTIGAFTEALQLKKYALYVFDYGAPMGFSIGDGAARASDGNRFAERECL